MFSIDEGVIVDAFAVVFRTDITFHTNAILPYLRFQFLGGVAQNHQIHAAIRGAALGGVVGRERAIFAVSDSGQSRRRHMSIRNQVLEQEGGTCGG
jgi:hypothetical protein